MKCHCKRRRTKGVSVIPSKQMLPNVSVCFTYHIFILCLCSISKDFTLVKEIVWTHYSRAIYKHINTHTHAHTSHSAIVSPHSHSHILVLHPVNCETHTFCWQRPYFNRTAAFILSLAVNQSHTILFFDSYYCLHVRNNFVFTFVFKFNLTFFFISLIQFD